MKRINLCLIEFVIGFIIYHLFYDRVNTFVSGALASALYCAIINIIEGIRLINTIEGIRRENANRKKM